MNHALVYFTSHYTQVRVPSNTLTQHIKDIASGSILTLVGHTADVHTSVIVSDTREHNR